jgi:hypothetical protein
MLLSGFSPLQPSPMTVATVAKVSYKSLILLVGDPANREKNRKFFKFRRASRLIWLTSPMISETWSQISYSMEQGIISAEQGILAQEQGFLPFKTEIIAG